MTDSIRMRGQPDILDRIKTAMEVESIAQKNVTLFDALRAIERLRETVRRLEAEVEVRTYTHTP